MLIDFGLAKVIEDGPSGLTTSTGFRGSTRWMAPELIEESSQTTPATDIWALGCLLLEIFLGRIPYWRKLRIEDIIYSIVSNNQTPASEDDLSSLPVDLTTLMLACWSPEPEKRPDIQRCLRVLTAVLEAEAPQPKSTSPELMDERQSQDVEPAVETPLGAPEAILAPVNQNGTAETAENVDDEQELGQGRFCGGCCFQ